MDYRKKAVYGTSFWHILMAGVNIILIITHFMLSMIPAYADETINSDRVLDEYLSDDLLTKNVDATISDIHAGDDHLSGSASEGESDLWDKVNSIVEMLPTIAAGVGVLMGVGYIRSLRERTNSAIFTYWSQISIRLMQIMSAIEEDKRLINNLYNNNERAAWEGAVISTEKIESFYDLAAETMQFLKTASDQMPAYVGWNNDYTVIVGFLADVIQYDIRDANNHFIPHQRSAQEDREHRISNLKQALSTILIEIRKRQTATEKKIYRAEQLWAAVKSFKIGHNGAK